MTLNHAIGVRVPIGQPMKFIAINQIPVSILSISILISLVIWYRFDLQTLQTIFSIFGSLSIVVALSAYFYKKDQDKTTSAIDQIAFFREKIIIEWDGTRKYIGQQKPNFILSRISLEKPTIEHIRNKFPKNFKRQSELFLYVKKNYPNVFIDGNILTKQVYLLNMLEEFSLKVIHFKTEDNPALKSVHNAFIEMVEHNAFALLFMRDVLT